MKLCSQAFFDLEPVPLRDIHGQRQGAGDEMFWNRLLLTPKAEERLEQLLIDVHQNGAPEK
jgi:hypothetical protein